MKYDTRKVQLAHVMERCDGNRCCHGKQYIAKPLNIGSYSNSVYTSLKMLLRTLIALLSTLASYQCSGCEDLAPPADFPYAWTLAFRGTANISKSVYDAYKSGAGIPSTVETGCRQVGSGIPCSNHYRNDDIINNWNTVTNVLVVLYERNLLVGYMLFNGVGSDYVSWFRPINLIDSSWADLKTSETNYFSMEGDVRPDGSLVRRFFVNRNYGGCENDWGWLLAVDTNIAPCPFEGKPNFPTFLYAKGSRGTNWHIGRVGRADVMAFYVK